MENTLTVIGPFSQIITLANLPDKGAIKDEDLEIIEQGGIVVRHGTIVDIGIYSDIKAKYTDAEHEIIEDEKVLLPGMIDCHTHICFSGIRAMDFAARNNGKTYLEIAKEGGGIWSSVKATRQASQEELTELILHRMDRLLQSGVTTVEVKSGYGLNAENELKMLRAIKQADLKHYISTIATCLAAHIIPKDFEGGEEAYLNYILKEIAPIVKEEKLASRFDAFIEESAFSTELSKKYLSELQEKGFDITIHGDQFTPGGSQVAVDLNALSVDHLEASTQNEIDLISQSSVIAVALPGASIGLGVAFTPARKLLDQGASVAIASDWNPGSAPQGDLLTQASILSTYEKLSAAEVWSGITFRAAQALGLHDRGRLQKGMKADMIAFPTNDYREILYLQGSFKPDQVWKEGERMILDDIFI